MPQIGMALEAVSPLLSRTLNPYNLKFGSGGSSGGDGAQAAMHGAPCAPLPTDMEVAFELQSHLMAYTKCAQVLTEYSERDRHHQGSTRSPSNCHVAHAVAA
jgi:hypothetical protein